VGTLAVSEARAKFAEILADPVQRAGEDPASLRAVVAWHRHGTRLQLIRMEIDPGVLVPLRTAGQALDAEIAERTNSMATAEAANRATRYTRTVSGETPLFVPEPITVEQFRNPDAVARWLVAHAGQYQLAVGRVFEHAVEWEGEVIGKKPAFVALDGWGAPAHTWGIVFGEALGTLAADGNRWGWQQTYAVPDGSIQTRCARWVLAGRIEAEAAADRTQGDALRSLVLDVLTKPRGMLPLPLQDELTDEEARWTLAPAGGPGSVNLDTERQATDGRSAEPKTVAKPGRRPLTDTKLDERIERRCRTFWREHQRGPATVEELSNKVRGARADRILARIKTLLAEGVLIVTEKGIKVDE